MVGDNVCSIAVDDLVIGLVMVDIVILYIISLLSTVGTQVWDLRLCILTPIIAMLMLTPFVMINHCGRLVGVKYSRQENSLDATSTFPGTFFMGPAGIALGVFLAVVCALVVTLIVRQINEWVDI